MPRIVQVTDTHLSPEKPAYAANWDICKEAIRGLRPDLVINTGDISLNGADSDADLIFAREQMDALNLPWRAIPGNHDIGDSPNETAPSQQEILPERRARSRAVFGDDWWCHDQAGWRLIGINAQLFQSELAPETEQWDFLEDAVAGGSEGRVVLFLHRPLFAHDATVDGERQRYVNQPVKTRLLNLIRRYRLQAVCSGHTHQWLSTHDRGTAYVWAPSPAFIIGDALQPVIGEKTVGFLSLDLGADGVSATLHRPAGLIRHEYPGARRPESSAGPH